MPGDTVLLPLCVGLSLLGVIATGVAWRRGNKGRVIQGAGLALAPIALYLTGLLGLLWNGAVAVIHWAAGIIFSPVIWAGIALLGLCLVLWVVGGAVAGRVNRRKAVARGAAKSTPTAAKGTSAATKGMTAKSGPQATRKSAAPPVDDEMAEIEALLKSRGIE